MSSQPGQNFVFVIFTRFYPPLFIRHVVRFVQFQGIRLMDWIGLYGNLQMASLTTSETKCDIATTWGRVRGAIINDFLLLFLELLFQYEEQFNCQIYERWFKEPIET